MTGRPPGRPRLTPAAPDESPAVDDGTDALEQFEPEELAIAALQGRAPLTPAIVRALNETWRAVAQGDDEGSKKLARDIVARLRRASHRELHPECTRVTVDMPMLPNKVFVRINERVYYGPVEVWTCEARTLLELVHRARVVEAARLDDKGGGGFLDLDSPLAERARAIQRA